MKKKIKIVRAEKLLYGLIGLLLVGSPVITVMSKAILSETNIEVEQLKNKINTQEKTNESLSMQIDELASLDKIQKVAYEKGLTYNNDNIKVISE